jgi:DNA-directed RNA polymerase specialized sigma24 family protein
LTRSFRSESRVSTWLIGIAYRVAMRSLRRQKGQRGGRSALTAQESYHVREWMLEPQTLARTR